MSLSIDNAASQKVLAVVDVGKLLCIWSRYNTLKTIKVFMAYKYPKKLQQS